MRLIILIVLLVSYKLSLPQLQIIDSIKNAMSHQNGDELLRSYHDLTRSYVNIENYDSALHYNKEIFDGLKIYPDSTLTVFALNYKGIIHLKTRQLDSAISAFSRIISYIDDNQSLIKHTIGAYGNRSLCYDQKDLSHKALEDLIQALDVAKKYNENQYVGILYGTIAMNFHAQGDYQKAVEYHLQAINIKKELKKKRSLAISYQNIALSYSKLKKYNLTFEYFEKGEVLFNEVNDQLGIALLNHYTGSTYLTLYNENIPIQADGKMSNPKLFLDTAIAMNRRALKQLKALNDQFYTTEVEIKLAEMYISANQPKVAQSLLNQLHQELQNSYSTRESTVASLLYQVNKLNNNYNEALKWHERYTIIEDSLNNKHVLKEIGKKQAELSFIKEQEIMQLKHQHEIQQLNRINEKKEIIVQNNRKRRTYIIVVITLAIFVSLLFLAIVFRRWKVTKLQKETINQQKQLIEKEKLATEDSINYAKNIQDAAFTSPTIFNELLKEHFIYFNPKDIVSGDFYWATKINEKKIIALADCTGHGVPGAFMTLISLNILNQIIADHITSPQKILEELHLRLQKRLNQSQEKTSKHGLDIALCVIDKNEMHFAGTHHSLYLVRNKELIKYKGDHFQLGGKKSPNFSTKSIKLELNDIFYIFTDGFPDQKGGLKNKKYFYPNFRKFLLSISELELEDQHQKIKEEFINWKGDNEQFDDVSVIGFKPL